MVAPKLLKHEFEAVVEPPDGEDRWWVAFCPEVPEANGQGDTETEAIEDLKSCIKFVLRDRLEAGLRKVSERGHKTRITIE